MKTALSFDDVLIVPTFSKIRSRSECSTKVDLNGLSLNVPIFSSNMDTVTESTMSNAMHKLGGAGVLHRFCSIEDNVVMFKEAPNSIVSIGVGENEKSRAAALVAAGANKWMLDVAHGATAVAAEMYKYLRTIRPNDWICVGNFATLHSYWDFRDEFDGMEEPNAIKVGIGSSGVCTTRVVTGCGLPTIESLLDFATHDGKNPMLIADGGIKTSGDIAKALAAGADAVMLGGLLSGTDETPGKVWEMVVDDLGKATVKKVKKYRGSASKESYEVQGKLADHRTPEGVSSYVSYKGPVANVIQELTAGLKSAMSYVGASTIEEFKRNAELVQVTSNGHKESKARA